MTQRDCFMVIEKAMPWWWNVLELLNKNTNTGLQYYICSCNCHISRNTKYYSLKYCPKFLLIISQQTINITISNILVQVSLKYKVEMMCPHIKDQEMIMVMNSQCIFSHINTVLYNYWLPVVIYKPTSLIKKTNSWLLP